eukprot:Lankesteria_metandrocarpae@DN2199_c0_g1_i1.p1
MQTFVTSNFQPSSMSPLAGMAHQSTLQSAGAGDYITSVTGATSSPHLPYSKPGGLVQPQIRSHWGSSTFIPATQGEVAGGLYSGGSVPYVGNTTAVPSAYQNYTPFSGATTTSARVGGPSSAVVQQQPYQSSGHTAPLHSAEYISAVGSNIQAATNMTSNVGLAGFTGHSGPLRQYQTPVPITTTNPVTRTVTSGTVNQPQVPQYSQHQNISVVPTTSYTTAPNPTTSYITAPNTSFSTGAVPTNGVGSYAPPVYTQYYQPTTATITQQQSFPSLPQAEHRRPSAKSFSPQKNVSSLSLMEDYVLSKANKFGVVEFPPKSLTQSKGKRTFHSLPRKGVGCFN